MQAMRASLSNTSVRVAVLDRLPLYRAQKARDRRGAVLQSVFHNDALSEVIRRQQRRNTTDERH